MLYNFVCACAAGVEMVTSWSVPPQTTLSHNGMSWLETVTRDFDSPHPSWNCSTTPETCEWPDHQCYTWSDRPCRCRSPLKNPDQWQADILCCFIQTHYFCVLGTRYLYVPWSRPQSCWLCRTPNMLSCLWMMTQISMWWQPLTDGASTSTLAMPKERWVSVSVAAFLIQHLFTSLRSKTAQVKEELCKLFVNDMQCYCC